MTQRVVHSQCKDTQLDGISNELMGQALQCIVTKGEFHLALSTSSSLDDLYLRLMYDPDLRAMPWSKTHVWFFGDSSSDDSIQIAITAHAGIPEEQVHFVGATTPEGTTIDCCVSDGVEATQLPAVFVRDCTSWLILANEQQAIECSRQISAGGVKHIFILEQETQENH